MRAIILAIIAVILLVSGGAYYLSQTGTDGTPDIVDPTLPAQAGPTVGATRVSPTDEPTLTSEPTSTDGQTQGSAPTDLGTFNTAPELGAILSNDLYATLRLENFGIHDFLVAQSNGIELFYLQNDGNIYSTAGANFDTLSVRGLGAIFDLRITNNATFNNGFSVTHGNVSVNGDFSFIGPHTISGTGALTINPTGNLNFQSSSYYINESGKLVVGELSATKLSYVGDITIDAKGEGQTTVAITNSTTGTANLSVEGDITVLGGKITLATGETIDAEIADTVRITSDGNIAFVLGDVSGAKKIYVYDSTGTNDVFSVDSDGNILADGNVTIVGSFTAASTAFSSLTVSGTATIAGLLTGNGGLSVTGDSSVTGTSTVGTLATGTTNNVVTHSSGLLQTRSIDGKVWNGALVDYLASTTGYLPMYSNSLGTLTNSSLFETGGKVGIGSTSPATLLDVHGTAWLRGASGGTSGLYVNSSGNVGVGTSNPLEALTVGGSLGLRGGSLWQPVYPTNDKLILYYPFTAHSGTKAFDGSPYAQNDGVVYSGASWGNGKYGYGMDFDGVSGYLLADTSALANWATNDDTTPLRNPGFPMTVSFWVKPSATGRQYILDNRDESRAGWSVYLSGTSSPLNVTFSIRTWPIAPPWEVSISASNVVPVGDWTHVAVVVDTSSQLVYVNGELKASGTYAGLGLNVRKALGIGCNRYGGSGTMTCDLGQYFTGSLDELYMYQRLLDSNEIRTQYLNGSQSDGVVYANQFRVVNSSANTNFILNASGNMGIGTTAPVSMLSVGASSQFQVNSTGNIVKLNNVTTSFPSSQGAANSFLRNDGAGTLTWADPAGTGVAGFWQRNGTSLAPTNIGDNVGIGTTTPNEQLEITGNLRLPATTSSTGIIKVGANRFIHNYGSNNTFLGDLAGNFTMTGANNTTVGTQSLLVNTTGGRNIALGGQTLYSNTTGYTNTAVGFQTLLTNTEGYGNSAFGAYAIYYNLTGLGNTANGVSALQNNTTGNYNTALGYNAGLINTTGSNNTFIGYNAGNSGSADGLTNATAIGYNAQVGASNSLILGNGANVGIGTTGPTQKLEVYNGNLYVNTGALYSDGATGSRGRLGLVGAGNTFTYDGDTLESYGASVYADSSLGNPGLALGGYNFINLFTNSLPRVTITNAGNVGIGTTGPGYKLEVNGTLRSASTATINTTFQNTLMTFTEDSSTVGTLISTGGGIRLRANTSNYIDMYANDLTLAAETVHTSSQLAVGSGAYPGSKLSVYGGGAIGTGYFATASPTNGLIIEGNVGIGTVSPGSKLSVSGSGTFGSGYATSAGPSNGLAIEGNVGIGTTGPGAKLEVNGTLKLYPAGDKGSSGAPNITISDDSTNKWTLLAMNSDVVWADRGFNFRTAKTTGGNGTVDALTIHFSGNVGIGTTSPSSKLNVVGTSNLVGSLNAGSSTEFVTISNTASTYNQIFSNYNGGSELPLILGTWTNRANQLYLATNGNVGIGTTGPGYLMELAKSQTADTKLRIGNTNTGASARTGLEVVSSTAAMSIYAYGAGNNDSAAPNLVTLFGSGSSEYRLWNYDNVATTFYTNNAERMRITNTGNVGIGTTSPSYKLDVLGTGRFTGNLAVGSLTTPYAQTITVAKSGGDYTTINAAYTYAKTLTPSATNQILIKIMPGVYIERLTLDTSYISVIGSGRENTKMTYGSGSVATLYSASAITGVEIADIYIEWTTITGGAYALDFTGANPSIYVHHSSLIDATAFTGISNYSSNARFENNIIQGQRIGIGSGLFRENTFQGGAYGIQPTGGTFINNKIDNLSTSGSGSGGTYVGNYIVSADAHGTMKFRNNYFVNGVSIDGGTPSFNGDRFDSNIVFGSGAATAIVSISNSTVNAGVTVYNNDPANAGTIRISNTTISGTIASLLTVNDASNSFKDFASKTSIYDNSSSTGLSITQSGSGYAATFMGGNVGIGTTSPGARLDVSPTVTDTSDLKGMLSGLVYNGASAMTNYYGHYIAAPTGTGTITNKYALVTEANAGNVGIGTTAPGYKLDVNGTGSFSGALSATADISAVGAGYALKSGAWISNAESTGLSLFGTNDTGFYALTNGGLQFVTKSGAAPSRTVTFATGGNVGIGTTGPASLFSVGASSQFQVNSSGYAFLPNGAVSTPSLAFSSDAGTGLYRVGQYNIGVAINNTLSAQFEYAKLTLPIDNSILTMGIADKQLVIQRNTSNGLYQFKSDGADVFSGFEFLNDNTVAMVINSSGNVGIGTTAPSSKLSIYNPTATTTDKLFDVTSDVTTVGNTVFKILANGDYQYDGTGSSPAADVAEIYPTTETGIVSGEIVSLSVGDVNAQTVIRSGMASDPNLLGVVTTKPALLLGSNIESGVAVALIGRVPVKVNDQNGVIAKGDYITSSSIAGEGMKATSAGMVVGRALEGRECVISNQGSVTSNLEFRNSNLEIGASVTSDCTVSVFMNVSWYDPNHEALALSTMPIDTSTITDLTLQTLSVLGDSTFVNATVTGSFNIGLLSIADSSLNVAGGVLKLQDAYGAGNIEAFGGKIVMTTDGSLQVLGSITADSINAKTVTTDTIQVEKGITIKDTETGEYYCVTVTGGELVRTLGLCQN